MFDHSNNNTAETSSPNNNTSDNNTPDPFVLELTSLLKHLNVAPFPYLAMVHYVSRDEVTNSYWVKMAEV